MSKRTAPTSRQREVVAPIPPVAEPVDLAQVRTEGLEVMNFLSPAALVEFFTKARELENEAGRMVAHARAAKRNLKAPGYVMTAEDDAAVQRDLLESKAQRKRLLEHWKISATVTRFRNLLTSARKRPDDLHEEGEGILQMLHNEYKAAEDRRVARENEEKRQQAIRDEQARRDAEERELSRQADEAEAASSELSPRERRVIDIVGDDITEGAWVHACRTVGYKDPVGAARALINREKIIAAIDGRRRAAAMRQQAQAVQQQPISTAHVMDEKPQVQRVGTDVVFKSAEIVDAAEFVAAAMSGRYGIPASTLAPVQSVLNDQARQMGALINRWPGIRYVEETRTRR